MLLHDGFSSPDSRGRPLTLLAGPRPIRPRVKVAIAPGRMQVLSPPARSSCRSQIKVRGRDKDLESPFAEMAAPADKEPGRRPQVANNDVSSRAPISCHCQKISINSDYGGTGGRKVSRDQQGHINPIYSYLSVLSRDTGRSTRLLAGLAPTNKYPISHLNRRRPNKLHSKPATRPCRVAQAGVHPSWLPCSMQCTHYQRRVPGSLATSTEKKPSRGVCGAKVERKNEILKILPDANCKIEQSFWNAQTQLQPAGPTDKDGLSHDDAAKGR